MNIRNRDYEKNIGTVKIRLLQELIKLTIQDIFKRSQRTRNIGNRTLVPNQRQVDELSPDKVQDTILTVNEDILIRNTHHNKSI